MNTPQDPGENSKAELLLSESEELLMPLVKLLVSQGVGFPQLAARLKFVFMEAARREILIEGSKPTDASISIRSGVHRKDVRSWREDTSETTPRKEFSVTDQVYTKWLADAAYKDQDGKPKPIPMTGPTPSFEALVASITRDLHRRTVLDELQRLGLVRTSVRAAEGTTEGLDWVIPIADSLVPRENLAEMMRFFTENGRDHLSASVENLVAVQHGVPAPFVERSVFAKGLSSQSVDQLGQLARQLWQPAFQQMVDAANQRYSSDKETMWPGGEHRMRFGVYFFSEPEQCPLANENGSKK
jgi:Family of unknown function (DUF6502)